MFLLMGIGAFSYRRGIITDRGSKDISALLINVVTPCLIIQSFRRDYDPAIFGQLMQALLLSAAVTVLAIVVAAVFFRRGKPDYADRRMCVVFPNNGFMALPLLQALCGGDGVFLGSVYIVVTNIFLWTYGVRTLCTASGRTENSRWYKMFLNPATLGFAVGMVIFVGSLPLPDIIGTPIDYLAALNTPLAMIVLGVYLAQSQLLDIIRDRTIYAVSLFRLLVIPLGTLVMLVLLPWDSLVCQVMIVSAATPCAIVSSMFAQQFGTNYRYSSRIIAFSTLLSAVTMPLMLSLYHVLA